MQILMGAGQRYLGFCREETLPQRMHVAGVLATIGYEHHEE